MKKLTKEEMNKLWAYKKPKYTVNQDGVYSKINDYIHNLVVKGYKK